MNGPTLQEFATGVQTAILIQKNMIAFSREKLHASIAQAEALVRSIRVVKGEGRRNQGMGRAAA